MPPADSNPPVPTSESPQTHALARAATWTSKYKKLLRPIPCTDYFSAYKIQLKGKYVKKSVVKQTPAFYKVNNEILSVTHEY
jgi:hypothetical protein